MDPIARDRLFGFRHAFDSPVTLWITIAVIAALLIAFVVIWLLHARGRTSDKLHDELVKRVVSWAVMMPLLLGPVLLGVAWTILAVVKLIILTLELNDVFAYIADKTFGHRKITPQTSPNKTLGGALGALVLTTTLVSTVGHFVFAGSGVDTPVKLIGLGLIVSVAGQFGDLMVSSIKRDIGIKDMGASIPGHGGLLDRFDSMLLVAPAVFHYIGFFRGFGLDQPTRIFTGG